MVPVFGSMDKSPVIPGSLSESCVSRSGDIRGRLFGTAIARPGGCLSPFGVYRLSNATVVHQVMRTFLSHTKAKDAN